MTFAIGHNTASGCKGIDFEGESITLFLTDDIKKDILDLLETLNEHGSGQVFRLFEVEHSLNSTRDKVYTILKEIPI